MWEMGDGIEKQLGMIDMEIFLCCSMQFYALCESQKHTRGQRKEFMYCYQAVKEWKLHFTCDLFDI